VCPSRSGQGEGGVGVGVGVGLPIGDAYRSAALPPGLPVRAILHEHPYDLLMPPLRGRRQRGGRPECQPIEVHLGQSNGQTVKRSTRGLPNEEAGVAWAMRSTRTTRTRLF
jgi:hypothetical protein